MSELVVGKIQRALGFPGSCGSKGQLRCRSLATITRSLAPHSRSPAGRKGDWFLVRVVHHGLNLDASSLGYYATAASSRAVLSK